MAARTLLEPISASVERSLSEHRVLHRRDEHIRCRLQGSASIRQWHLEHATVSGAQRVRLDADLTLGVVEPVGTHCVQPGHRRAPAQALPGTQDLMSSIFDGTSSASSYMSAMWRHSRDPRRPVCERSPAGTWHGRRAEVTSRVLS